MLLVLSFELMPFVLLYRVLGSYTAWLRAARRRPRRSTRASS
ncbi:hypothetical protein WMF38_40150 [Sorangium sp. So ce118]